MSDVEKIYDGYMKMVIPNERLSRYGCTEVVLHHYENEFDKRQTFVLMCKTPYDKEWNKHDNIRTVLEDTALRLLRMVEDGDHDV